MTDSNDLPKQHGEDTAFRSTLRRSCILAREAMPAAEHARKSAVVLDRLYALLSPRKPSALGFYWPIRAEIDCRSLAIRLIAQGWRACLPLIVDRDAPLGFRAWTPQSAMTDGEHGIPTVATGPLISPDVLLLPLNAFDRKGYRLGYGGGYYDRTLAAMPAHPYVVGVGFDLARVDSIRPQDHDCRMDAVVTECGTEVLLLQDGCGRDRDWR